jgi:hypothetical protein
MLGCIVLGEDNAFPIDFDMNKTVGHLKKAILEKKNNTFSGIDARDLILWKVDIPQSDKRNIHMGIDIKQKFEGVELDDDLTPIREHFEKEPSEEHIHIIVQPPGNGLS